MTVSAWTCLLAVCVFSRRHDSLTLVLFLAALYKTRRIRKETRRRTEEEKRDKDGWWRMEKEVTEVVTGEKI